MGAAFKLRNGSILLITEAPGGIYNSEQLKKIALLADDEAAIIKVTEDQRLALFVNESKATDIVEELKSIGLGIRHYQDGLHQPTTCIGELCPDYQQDALGLALKVTEKISNYTIDNPLKIGINGCSKCCVPCHTLDVSAVGDEQGYRISLGGKNSQIPEMATFIAENIPGSEMPEFISKIISLYKEHGESEESLQDVMDRIGVSKFAEILSPYSQDAAALEDNMFGGMGDSEEHSSKETISGSKASDLDDTNAVEGEVVDDLAVEDMEGEELESESLANEDLDIDDFERDELETDDLEAESLESDLETEDLEVESLENDDLETEDLEVESLENADLETEDLEVESLENADLETEDLEVESFESAELNSESLDLESSENEGLGTDSFASGENLEVESLENDELETDNLEVDSLENDELETDDLEIESLEKEELESEALEIETLEDEELATQNLDSNEDLEIESLENEALESDDLEIENLENDGMESENLDSDALEIANLENDELESEKLDSEELELESFENDDLEVESLERDVLAVDSFEGDDADLEGLESGDMEAKSLGGNDDETPRRQDQEDMENAENLEETRKEHQSIAPVQELPSSSDDGSNDFDIEGLEISQDGDLILSFFSGFSIQLNPKLLKKGSRKFRLGNKLVEIGMQKNRAYIEFDDGLKMNIPIKAA